MAASASSEYCGASPAAIRHHYDLSNEFFALWLDESLTYSCALWEGDDDTLFAAQQRKLDYLLERAGVRSGSRLLDVGCGWGSAIERAISVHGASHAVGLTLSDAQAGRIRAANRPKREVRVESFTDHVPEKPGYDAILSIGAFEHFASYGLSRAQRMVSYRGFFDRCRDWLPRGGRVALQSNVKGNNLRLDRQTVRDLEFVIETIFPESQIPWLSEILEASERRFDVLSVTQDAAGYARTAQAWLDRLRSQERAAIELVGANVYADYIRYLAATVGHFQRRHLGLCRIIFEAV